MSAGIPAAGDRGVRAGKSATVVSPVGPLRRSIIGSPGDRASGTTS